MEPGSLDTILEKRKCDGENRGSPTQSNTRRVRYDTEVKRKYGSNVSAQFRTLGNIFHRLAYRCFGFWSPHLDSSSIFKLFYKIYNKLALGLICAFAGTLLADLTLSYGNLTIVTDDGCFLAGITVVIFKLFVFQTRREKIERLIEAIHNPVEILQCSSDRSVVMLVESFVFYEKMTVYGLSGIAGILIVALIFFVPTENGSLPIRAKYPFDTTVQPMHTVAFAIQASAVTAGIVAILMMDSIVIGFCRFTLLQLQVLNSNFENCRSSTSTRDSPALPVEDLDASFFNRENLDIRSFVPFDSEEVDEVSDCFLKRFKTCVKHHQRLIQIVNDINELFSSSMLVQLCASTSMICLTGFQAALGAKESANLIKFSLYLGAAFSQLLCWSWYGNTLIYQSETLAAGQWCSGWEREKDLSAVTVLIIVSLIRSRSPMGLTAGKFYTMSLTTFITILRSSYSFFTLLTAVNDEG